MPLIPGRTLILFYIRGMPLEQLDFSLPPDPEENNLENKITPSVRACFHTVKAGTWTIWVTKTLLTSLLLFVSCQLEEVSVLLSLMIASCVEDCQLYSHNFKHVDEVKLKSDDILENVRIIVKQIQVRIFSVALFVFFSPSGKCSSFLPSHSNPFSFQNWFCFKEKSVKKISVWSQLNHVYYMYL